MLDTGMVDTSVMRVDSVTGSAVSMAVTAKIKMRNKYVNIVHRLVSNQLEEQ